MNWEAISAIAELLGILGVIASLVYLAIQVRQNSRLIEQNNQISRSSMVHETSVSYTQFFALLAENEELTDIYLRGIKNAELSDIERVRFKSLINISASWLEDADHQFRADLYFDEEDDDDLIDFMAPAYRKLFASDVGKEWWREEAKFIHTPSFYEKVSRIMHAWENDPKPV